MKVRAKVNVQSFHDARGTAELRRHADSLAEKFWRVRVARNEARRRAQAAMVSGATQ